MIFAVSRGFYFRYSRKYLNLQRILKLSAHCKIYVHVHLAKFLIGHLTFYASFENNVRLCKIYASINQPRFWQDCISFHLKMTGTSCTDDVRVKVPTFQKSHLFYNIK